jgi:hypothetical protein
MTLAASALAIAFALSSRPAWLRGLVPWVHVPKSRRAG